jgi:DNA-binding NtrC family response regulator
MIMICDPHPRHDEGVRVADSLVDRGYRVRSFTDGARFLEAAVAQPPDLVLYALGPELEEDLGVLRLMRRAHPELKLIVLAAEPSLRVRAAVQALRPTFSIAAPPEPDEVLEVVKAALERRDRHA